MKFSPLLYISVLGRIYWLRINSIMVEVPSQSDSLVDALFVPFSFDF